jgi:hypothetical protein
LKQQIEALGLGDDATAAAAVSAAAKSINAAYAKRDVTVLESRWGAEEIARVSKGASAPAVATAAATAAVAKAAAVVNAAYAKRDVVVLRSRWGSEEITRVSNGAAGLAATPAAAAPPSNVAADAAEKINAFFAKVATKEVVPSAASSSAAMAPNAAYAQRDPAVLSARWGAEEVERVKSVGATAASSSTSSSSAAMAPNAAYAQRDPAVLSARWGAEEVERVKSAGVSSMGDASGDLAAENKLLKDQIAELEGKMRQFLVDQHEARLKAIADAQAKTAVIYDTKISELEAKIVSMEMDYLYGGNEAAAQAAKINSVFKGWKEGK